MDAVYLQYFGLSEAPFSITPDPAFVYLSAAHRDALAHLLYGVGQGSAGGFVQLTGEVGTGKTTLCRCLLDQVKGDTRIALILNPLMTRLELLATIGEELGIEMADIADSNKAMVDALNAYLLEQHADGNRVVVVIDEAQNLSPEALEQVRLLTNLETPKHKLLQMVLLGQPELRQLLQRQNLRQLSQRITARYHLTPLSEEETTAYVRHRMNVAGALHNPFSRGAVKALFQRSLGIPRLINIIADRALAGAYAGETQTINARLMHQAATEVQPGEPQLEPTRLPWLIAAASVFVLLAVTIMFLGAQWWGGELPPVATLAVSADHARPADAVVSEPSPQNSAAVEAGLELAREADTSGAADDAVQPASRDTALLSEVASAIVGNEARADAYLESAQRTKPETELEPQVAMVAGDLDDEWLDAGHASAWQDLALIWGDPRDARLLRSACDGEHGVGYACLREQGSLARIQQIGLPVLLVLRRDGARHLILRGISGNGLLVGGGDPPQLVARSAVVQFWLGEFFVVWPQAPDWPVQIGRGESGSAVDIVMEMASLAATPWQGGGHFDGQFELWLMAFQHQHGLDADGIVGPNTLLQLMAPTIDNPRLIVHTDRRQ